MPSSIVRPEFFEKLAIAYFARLARCVILTGNINDVFPFGPQGDSQKIFFVPLERLLRSAFESVRYPENGGTDRFIALIVKSDGIHFVSPDDEKELQKFCKDFNKPSESSADLVRAIADFLRNIARAREELETSQHYIRPVCIIVDQAETIFPNLEIDRMTAQDRQAWRCFYDLLRDENIWAGRDTANKRPDFIILLSPTIAEINAKILTAPKTEAIEIALPDEEMRRQFIAQETFCLQADAFYQGDKNPVKMCVADSRGLALRNIDDLITSAVRHGKNPLDRKSVVAETNKRLALELGGIVKMVRPEHTMQDIIGFGKLKARLDFLAHWIDDNERAPAGMTVVGPNGAGKTFIIEAWAAATGRDVLTFGEVRSEWYGRTESFMEKFEAAAWAYGRICVVIDEAHKAFGSLHDKRTYETEAHLTRSVIQMMSNPKYRAKIFWVLITTRPDMLDPDFVRSGRCSLFVPIFDPEGEDADAFFNWMADNFRQEGIELSEEEINLLKEKSRGEKKFSAGDYKKFLDEFIYERRYRRNQMCVDLGLTEFLAGWIPSSVTIGREREFQTYLAALRCSWPELLPESMRSITQEEMQKRIDALSFGFSIS